MIVNGKNVMTSDERKEIITLLVKEGYNHAGLRALDDKQLAKCLRRFREEELTNKAQA